MTSKEKTIYLIDGSGYIYRAYHAVRHLSTSRGLPTNATFGFTNMLLKLLSEKKSEYMAMAFDAKGPTFRHEIYEAYKANRPPMPEDLAVQIPYIKQIVEGMNIPSLECEGYEADDIIGTVARTAEMKGFRVVMVTGDKDFKQLVSRRISIWDPMKDRIIDYEGLKKDFGLEPSQWVDVMALAGDTSDNIPGVPGIGEKTAIKLVKSFGSVAGIYRNLDKITKKKLRENLANFREQAMLSRGLVAINTEVPLSVELASFRISDPDADRLARLFQDLEFQRLQKQFLIRSDLSHKNYRVILDDEGLKTLINELKQAGMFALDIETTAKDPMRAEIVGLSFSCRPNEAAYIPLRHRYSGAPTQLDPDRTLASLKPLLEDPKLAKVGQNIKYDWTILKRAGVDLQGVIFDTMVASYLLNPTRRSHSLEAIAAEYLDHKMISYKEVTGGNKGFDKVTVEDAMPYACEDADMTLMAYEALNPKLHEGGFDSLFKEVEMPLVPVLVDMEMTGICVDKDRLEAVSKDFERQLHEIEDRIYAMAGESFNIQSHQQLGRILFEKLKLPIQKKTKKKTGYSTDVEVLTALSVEHEIPALVLQYRSLAKLKSTYADALVDLIHPETHRIHTSYNQTITATGRLSSSDPNLQNIPVRTEEGRKIRAAFIPREGWTLLSADYSQIELRLLAHYSQDPILVEAFEQDQDIHARTAAEVFQLLPGMLTREMRRQAKVINFGIIYGMSPFRLSKELGISQKMAKMYIKNYFNRYTGVKRFIEEIKEDARKAGKVTTLLGRHRWLPDISSPNRIAREFAERTAVNTPLQGTAADLIKVAMIRIHQALDQMRLKAKMLLQVHDELVFETPPEELTRVKKLVAEIMEGAYKLSVPLKVDMRTGRNWAEVD
ncbi:MAG: DNA polymerase I [Deltaproteobacteria bacterium]|nr:DNA polymerase I [Deltaproteobacteria bacterium]MBW2019054.1 DNA polymerase I [Deltaproteobacteria bacterium]MBW2073814.1 DNA polymerase I [Deltaproteobacteria bacterium]RLB82936.1 MAG: DNA polymerase I [Deltaproteobacteria bacterium]